MFKNKANETIQGHKNHHCRYTKNQKKNTLFGKTTKLNKAKIDADVTNNDAADSNKSSSRRKRVNGRINDGIIKVSKLPLIILLNNLP